MRLLGFPSCPIRPSKGCGAPAVPLFEPSFQARRSSGRSRPNPARSNASSRSLLYESWGQYKPKRRGVQGFSFSGIFVRRLRDSWRRRFHGLVRAGRCPRSLHAGRSYSLQPRPSNWAAHIFVADDSERCETREKRAGKQRVDLMPGRDHRRLLETRARRTDGWERIKGRAAPHRAARTRSGASAAKCRVPLRRLFDGLKPDATRVSELR